VHELHADCPAVGIAKTIKDFSQLHRALLAERSAGKHAIQIRFRESVRCEVQFGCLEAAQPEGVHVGNAVSSYAVVPNESIDTLLQRGPGLAVVAGRRRGRQLEIASPVCRNRRGIPEVSLVKSFNEGKIHAVGKDVVLCHRCASCVSCLKYNQILELERRATA
jgi:hypothetical protein